jgi:hypothetical protein
MGSLDEHVQDEVDTDALTRDYIERKSAATDAEYGWPPGTCLALWETQDERKNDWNGDGFLDDLRTGSMGARVDPLYRR